MRQALRADSAVTSHALDRCIQTTVPGVRSGAESLLKRDSVMTTTDAERGE